MPPKVSIITIVRNGEETLPLALASLLRQSLTDWECILVNDASTDGTQGFIDSLTDPRFKCHHSTEPLGRGRARNLALSKATGEYIGTLDCDDFLVSDALRLHVEVLDADEEIAASVAPLWLFDDQGQPSRFRRGLKAGKRLIPKATTELKVPFAALVFRHSLLGQHQYSEKFYRSEDRDFFSRFLAGKQILVLGKPLYCYYWSFKPNEVLSGILQNEKIYARQLRAYPLQTLRVLVLNRAKYALYKLLVLLGFECLLVRWRTLELSHSEIHLFKRELDFTRNFERSLKGPLNIASDDS